MLVLTRRMGQKIMVGDDVTIEVVGIRGGYVTLGVTATRDVAVHREEVVERIRAGAPRKKRLTPAEPPE